MTNKNYSLNNITNCLATTCLCFAVTFVLPIVIYIEVTKNRDTNHNNNHTTSDDISIKINDSESSSIVAPPHPMGMTHNYTENETNI